MSAAVSEVMEAESEVVKSDALAPAFVGLEPNSARQLREAFVPALLQIEEWERQASELTVTDESQTAKMEMAGVMRKALKKVRISVDKRRKELNADALARTKAINCAAGIVEGLIVPLEKRLQEQETFLERAQAARRDKLRDARAEAIRAYGTDPSTLADLGLMGDESWSSTLETARLAHEAKIEAAKQAEAVRIAAEKLAEEARVRARAEAVRLEAERVERERVQAEENARLKREATEREEAARVEREAAAAERARLEAQARAEREAAQAAALRAQQEAEAEAKQARAAADAEKAKIEAEAKAGREAAEAETRKANEKAEAVARELAETRAASAKAAHDRAKAESDRLAKEEADRNAALLAPDREKLIAFAAVLRGLEIPTLTTDTGKAAAAKVGDQISKMAAWIERQAASL